MKRNETTMTAWCRPARGVKAVLCLLMLMAVQVVMAFDYHGISYTVNADGKTATATGLASGCEMPRTLIIPDYAYDGETAYAVTAVGEKAFFSSKDVQTVVIGDYVETIAYAAFYEFGQSEESHTLILGKRVKNLGFEGAFYSIGDRYKDGVYQIEPKNTIYIKGDDLASIPYSILYQDATGATVYFKDEATYNKFKADSQWSQFDNATYGKKLAYGFAADMTLKGGQWQTAIFPDALTQEQLETYFGYGTKVARLNEEKYQWESETSPYIVRFDLQDHVVAGEPLLICPAKDIQYVSGTEWGFPSDGFKPRVTMEDAKHQIRVSMIGVWHDDYNLDFGQIYLRNEDGRMQFFSADNAESDPSAKSDVWVKRGKCYFEMRDLDDNLLYDIPVSPDVQPAATAIRDIQPATQSHRQGVYSLTGQYEGTTLEGLPSGIHIVNGRKVVVK